MHKGKRRTTIFQGVWRARRPKTGKNKGMLILLTREEKLHIERAAAKAGVRMSRFSMERSLPAPQMFCPNRKAKCSRAACQASNSREIALGMEIECEWRLV